MRKSIFAKLNEPQAIIVGALITGACAMLAAIVALFPNSPVLPIPLPTGLPSATPKPTVVGTPIIGADIAAAGKIGFVTKANGISFVVDEVKAYQKDLSGHPEREGYAYVVVKARIVNQSNIVIYGHFDITLVDDYSN